MKGMIETYDTTTAQGTVRARDGGSYPFATAVIGNVRNKVVGTPVEFQVENGRAVDIVSIRMSWWEVFTTACIG